MGNIKYTPEQINTAEQTIKIIQSIPEDIRDIVALVANAYADGFIAGQNVSSQKNTPNVIVQQ